MTISRITQKIHSKEANLWQIQRANEGVMPYAILHPNPEKRIKRTEILHKEIKELKAKRDKIKQTTPKENWYPARRNAGRKKGSKTKYYNNHGNSYTQEEIDRLRSEAYQKKYAGRPDPMLCEGCRDAYAQGSAHSIPQAICKQIHKPELIWDTTDYAFWPACHKCNRKAENPKGDWETLKNSQQMLSYIEKHAPELYLKFINKI